MKYKTHDDNSMKNRSHYHKSTYKKSCSHGACKDPDVGIVAVAFPALVFGHRGVGKVTIDQMVHNQTPGQHTDC